MTFKLDRRDRALDEMPATPPHGEIPLLEEEIRALLAEYDRCWQELDMRSLYRLWDPDDHDPMYIGGEYSAPIIGRGELGRHWGRLGGRITSAQTTSSLSHVKLLTPDVALVVYLCEWEFETADTDLCNVGQDWVTAVLRRKADGWRFIHQAESATFNAGVTATNASTDE